jgi:hypothetical protein
MCDEREPLLTYLYDESDPVERQRVEAHLASCETCRDELAGLRRVREDLLAWDVPDHGSVWRPFVPVRPSWSWRDVPAWTLAAAAAVVFAIGAGSSVAANAWLGHSAPTRAAIVVPAAATPVAGPAAPSGVTTAELTAFETQLVKRLDDAKATARANGGLSSAEYSQLLDVIKGEHNELMTSLTSSRNDVTRLTQRVSLLETQLAQAQQGGQGGR